MTYEEIIDTIRRLVVIINDDVNIVVIANDLNTNLTTIIGNSCSCCALNSLQEYIDENGLQHMEQISKEKIN